MWPWLLQLAWGGLLQRAARRAVPHSRVGQLQESGLPAQRACRGGFLVSEEQLARAARALGHKVEEAQRVRADCTRSLIDPQISEERKERASRQREEEAVDVFLAHLVEEIAHLGEPGAHQQVVSHAWPILVQPFAHRLVPDRPLGMGVDADAIVDESVVIGRTTCSDRENCVVRRERELQVGLGKHVTAVESSRLELRDARLLAKDVRLLLVQLEGGQLPRKVRIFVAELPLATEQPE